MLLVANKCFAYDNKLLAVGETFEVRNKMHARVLTLNNLASAAPAPMSPPIEQERAKRKYKRRDMQAIDE